MNASAPQTVFEKFGLVSGYALGILTGAASLLRRSRVFHPRGMALLGHRKDALRPAEMAGKEFPRSVLVRFSSALWKNREWPDVLGLALRFTRTEKPGTLPEFGDQDILFATIIAPLLTPLGPFMTRYWDYLSNFYYGVSPFEFPDGSLRYLRVRPAECEKAKRRKRITGETRVERLRLEIGTSLFLESSLQRFGGEWSMLAEIALTGESSIDQEALRFSPFRDGLGLRPRGYVHYLRVGAYGWSQSARPRVADSVAKT